MSVPEMTAVLVRDLPVDVMERIRAKAVSEGVKRGDGAVALWALTQFAKTLNGNNETDDT